MLYRIPLSHLCVKTSRACTFDDQMIFKDLIRIQYQTIPNKYILKTFRSKLATVTEIHKIKVLEAQNEH